MGTQPMKYANGETPKRGQRKAPPIDPESGQIRTITPKEAEFMASAIAQQRELERADQEEAAAFSGRRTARLLTIAGLYSLLFRR